MKGLTSFLLYIFIVTAFVCTGQKETNFWYFGDKAGLNFNSGSPVAVTDGMLQNWEGGSTISDSSGKLLFYTNGLRVWNRQHAQMPNGIYLNGHISSSQAAIIIPKPESNTLFYVFTTDEYTLGIQYSEVDMTLQGGLGDVNSNKNIVLKTLSTEKLTAVKHCNGKDFWVLSHDRNSNAFRCFLVTALGVNTTPVISYAGLNCVGFSSQVGQMKVSPNGKKLASANTGLNKFELFDFDPATGIVSNGIVFPTMPAGSEGAYGVEFSPDGTKLYGTIVSPGKIYQWDLAAGSTSAILNSGKLLGTSNFFGPLQLGPNGKIYMADAYSSNLGVIHKPNLIATLCQYAPNSLSLLGRASNFSLPGFPSSYLYKANTKPFIFSFKCMRGNFIIAPSNETSSINYVWNFGDVNSAANNIAYGDSADHIFSGPGVYTITLSQIKACETITISQVVTITPQIGQPVFHAGTTICSGESVCIKSGLSGACVWSGGETTTEICVQPSVTTAYHLQISDSIGCLFQSDPVVKVKPLPQVKINVAPQTSTSFLLIPSGGQNYKWHSQKGLSCYECVSVVAEISDPTQFCVDVTDSVGCSNTGCINLTLKTVFIPNAFTPNNDGVNDVFIPVIHNEVSDYLLLIYNRWGEKIYGSVSVNAGWDGILNTENCEDGIYTYQISFTDVLNKAQAFYSGKLLLYR